MQSRTMSYLTSLATPKTDSLPVLLKFGDQSITVLDHISVLLVLVIRSVGFNDAIDSVDRASNAIARDKLGQIPENY